MTTNYHEGIAHQDLACPECGSPMELAFSDRFFYRKSGQRRPYYRCYKYPECKGTHGAHPNGAPLGKPATHEVRQLRIRVHAALDRIYPWKTKKGRRATNKWLLEHGLGEGHVANMGAEECKRALEILGVALK